jgi:hypothetical protein
LKKKKNYGTIVAKLWKKQLIMSERIEPEATKTIKQRRNESKLKTGKGKTISFKKRK